MKKTLVSFVLAIIVVMALSSITFADEPLTCNQIVDNYSRMTQVQWSDFVSNTATGADMVEWEGTIDRVEGYSWLNGGYPVHIEVIPDCKIYFIEADEKIALSYNSSDKIVMNGKVQNISAFWGSITIFVKDDTFKIELSGQTEENSDLTVFGGDGFYRVGTEIATGSWTTEPGDEDCYWALLNEQQEILKNHFGLSGGTITITEGAYELEIKDCGKLIAVDDAQIAHVLGDGSMLIKDKYDGFFTVGVEIAVGKWETQNGHDSCYWALLDDQQEILKNHFGASGGVINVTSDSYELEIHDCGKLTFIDVKPAQPGSPVNTTSGASNNAVANSAANLRSGPGTNYPVVGGVQSGQVLKVVAKNADGSWLKLESGQWIAAFLVNNVPSNLPNQSQATDQKTNKILTLHPTATPTQQGLIINSMSVVGKSMTEAEKILGRPGVVYDHEKGALQNDAILSKDYKLGKYTLIGFYDEFDVLQGLTVEIPEDDKYALDDWKTLLNLVGLPQQYPDFVGITRASWDFDKYKVEIDTYDGYVWQIMIWLNN